MNAILARNMSCLFKTAKEEIERCKLIASIGTPSPSSSQPPPPPSLQHTPHQQPRQRPPYTPSPSTHHRVMPNTGEQDARSFNGRTLPREQPQQQAQPPPQPLPQQQHKRPGSTNGIDFNRIDEEARKRARNE